MRTIWQPDLHEIQGLANAGRGVHGVAGDHGLDDDGVVAADDDAAAAGVADRDLSGETTSELVEGIAIAHGLGDLGLNPPPSVDGSCSGAEPAGSAGDKAG
jgi:hypothetical protein